LNIIVAWNSQYKQNGKKCQNIKRQRGITSFINKGYRESDILDYYEQHQNIKIDRNFRVLSYFPDGYCHKTNTVFEVYEPYHLTPGQMKKDHMRQQDIQEELNCNFVIIYDDRITPINDLNITKDGIH
jgi:very-short-patch-repair endonuclease